MPTKNTHTLIQKFLKSSKQTWQIFFLASLLPYAISFAYRLQTQTSFTPGRLQTALNWISFFLALAMALTIFNLKRKYFTLRYFKQYFTARHEAEPELDEPDLLRHFTRHIGRQLKLVWLLGATIVGLGVLYYWLTFDSWNMHVYFIVGLYSLVINYPRRELFTDGGYLLQEVMAGKKENHGKKPLPD